jgi:glycerophosphoryl diester phosphodiesterase
LELIAHRGGASLGPENSLEAIVASLAAGADGVEVDVRLTADLALVLTHDPVVERADGRKIRVSEMALADVRALGAPTLEEVLDAVPADRLIVIELKGHPWEAGYDPDEPAAHAVAKVLVLGGDRRVVISSFNPLALGVVREDAPGTRTAILTAEAFDLGTNLAAALDGGHEECHVPARLLDEAFVEEAHAAGPRVVAWTVDDPERLRAFDAWGVDGVICDDPAAARRALR